VIPGVPALAAAAASAGLHLRAESRGPRWQVYLFKPLTTAILLLLAVLAPPAQGARYQAAIGLGLGFSLVGDVLLMLPVDRFVAGLASFFLAHVAYVAAFTARVPLGARPGLLLPLLVVAALLLQAIRPGLGKFRPAVVLYAAMMVLMVWTAWGRQGARPGTASLLAGIGAALFMVSDALLALNRFGRPFRNAQALVMTTYVAAQALIALSVSAR
jgi:uncharacterized membrane protein YhhN